MLQGTSAGWQESSDVQHITEVILESRDFWHCMHGVILTTAPQILRQDESREDRNSQEGAISLKELYVKNLYIRAWVQGVIKHNGKDIFIG